MANEEHLEILKQGVPVWNKWREDNLIITPNLKGADLSGADLSHANFRGANLISANFSGADLRRTSFSRANLNYGNFVDAYLRNAHLDGAHLFGSNFTGANLGEAKLMAANFRSADLTGANLIDTNLTSADFIRTTLDGASLIMARIGGTSFVDTDLSPVIGLETVRHDGPSTIGIDTLYKSGGKIPLEFLRGCGIPDDFITFIPSHFGIKEAIQFYSCFISYSTKDEEFARRLYSRMRDEKMRVWFAPEEMKGGEKVHEQIERAIQLHDRLLVVLSEESMKSNWVINEIRNARRVELREGRRKLFPIGLTGFDRIKEWKRVDPDTGEDLALELRSYYIPDFSNWKDHDAFEREFAKLLRDLRAEEK